MYEPWCDAMQVIRRHRFPLIKKWARFIEYAIEDFGYNEEVTKVFDFKRKMRGIQMIQGNPLPNLKEAKKKGEILMMLTSIARRHCEDRPPKNIHIQGVDKKDMSGLVLWCKAMTGNTAYQLEHNKRDKKKKEKEYPLDYPDSSEEDSEEDNEGDNLQMPDLGINWFPPVYEPPNDDTTHGEGIDPDFFWMNTEEEDTLHTQPREEGEGPETQEHHEAGAGPSSGRSRRRSNRLSSPQPQSYEAKRSRK